MVVDRSYVEINTPTVTDRLVKAGVRLGNLLNQALSTYSSGAHLGLGRCNDCIRCDMHDDMRLVISVWNSRPPRPRRRRFDLAVVRELLPSAEAGPVRRLMPMRVG